MVAARLKLKNTIRLFAINWTGRQPMMHVEQLAAYAAPALWFFSQ